MFKDFKSGGFNLKDTWSTDIHYVKILYFCVCIAYTYVIFLRASCIKDNKNNLLGATKNINRKKVRVYSLFTIGIKWFKRIYYSCRKKSDLRTVNNHIMDNINFEKKFILKNIKNHLFIV